MQNEGPDPRIPSPGLLSRIPAVSRLLETDALRRLTEDYGAGLVTDLLREALERLREGVRAGRLDDAALDGATDPGAIADEVGARAALLTRPRPRAVINATGVVVHTNLGRSTLSERAAEQVAAAARGYVDLEYDVAEGARGNRLACLEPLMERLFPGVSFTVVNNNAAAVLLCLRALSAGREVVVSRGELVEIGGSFRVPDIMAASGARLREVGTTNRTRLADYEKALSEASGLILKVHTSNFKVVGFVEETTVAQLSGLAGRSGVPLMVDWGSGDLVDLEPLEIRDEMPVSRVLADGADLVTFSGDKLLGGPQAGFVVGRRELVERVRRDPLARVCRLDRLRLGALQQTLAAYATGRCFEEIPTLRMLALSSEEIGRRATALRDALVARNVEPRWLSIVDGVSRTGGGSAPSGERPTRLVAVAVPGGDAGSLERRLRDGDPPVVGRVRAGRLLLDLRTVLPVEQELLAERLIEAWEAEVGPVRR